MQIIHYPDKKSVDAAIKHDDPLLMLVSLDGETVIVSNIDDSMEHHILLKKNGLFEND